MLKEDQAITDLKVQLLCASQNDLLDRYISNRRDIEVLYGKFLAQSDKEDVYVFHAPDSLSSFTGRKCQIREIEAILNNDEQPSPLLARKAAICGLGGSGKTSLAAEYAHCKKNHYQGGVFWFSGEGEKNLESSVNDLALFFGTFVSNRFAVTLSQTLARISRIQKPWLLIIDDMDELQLSPSVRKLLSGSWQKNSKGHIIVTTRREPNKLANDLEEIKESSCLVLQCFNVDDAIAFLFHRTGIERTEDNEDAARNIFEEFGGLPLALEQAASYIKYLGCSFTLYLETYQAKHLALLKQQAVNPISEYSSEDRLAVQTTWLLNIDYIKKNSEGTNAMLFLNACIFFNPNEIQEELINVGEPPIKDEQFRIFVGTTLGQYQIIKLLTDISLFKQCSSRCLQVHRLVIEVIKEGLSPSEKDKSFIDAVRLLQYCISKAYSPDELLSSVADRENNVVDYTNPSLFYKWRKLCAHAGEIEKNLKIVCHDKRYSTKISVFSLETAQIVYQYAVYLSAFCKHEEAMEAMNFAVKILDWIPEDECEWSAQFNSLFPHRLPLPEFIRRHIQYCSKASALPIPAHMHGRSGESPSKADGEECRKLREEGNRLFRENRFHEAVEVYSSGIDMKKGSAFLDPRFFSNRSSAYLKLKLYEKALEDAKAYISVRPKCWKGYARKALALHGMDREFNAEMAAAQTYSLAPEVFSRYDPFKKFSYLEKCTTKCHSASDLLHSLMNGGPAVRVIFLHPGVYEITKDVEFGNCIVLGCIDQPDGSTVQIKFEGYSKAFVLTKCALVNLNFVFDENQLQFLQNSIGIICNCSFTNNTSINSPLCVSLGLTEVEECNFISSCAGGFLCENGTSHVENCTFSNNRAAGLEVRKDGILLAKNVHSFNNGQGLVIGPKAKRCVLTNSQINCNLHEGIFAIECDQKNADIQLSNNSISHNDAFGISVVNSPVIISENRVFENNWWGVWLRSNPPSRISKNRVTGNRLGGIRIGLLPEGCVPSIVEYNTITDNGGPGLLQNLYEFDVSSFFFDKIIPDNVALRRDTLVSPQCQENIQNRNGKDHTRTQSSNFANNIDQLCSHCREKGTLRRCTKCYTAEYCGRECQKKHWNKHKNVCQSLLDQSSILLTSTTARLQDTRGTIAVPSGLEKVGPNSSQPPPENGKRFIVKVQQKYDVSRYSVSAYLVIYDRSMTIHEEFNSAHVQNLIRDLGSICERKYKEKKLFMWAAYTDDKVIRLFTNDFPPYQGW